MSRCWTRPAELLGELDASAGRDTAAREAESRRDLANAERTLENVNESLIDSGVDGVVTAEALAQHNAVSATRLTPRSAPPGTAPGPSGTSLSTRRRNSPPCSGAC
jgi:hypothetical protein